MTVEQMLEMPYYHPTLEEGLRTACKTSMPSCAPPGRAGKSVTQQFVNRAQLLHMLRHDLDDDNDGNA
jgi:hypothetical protein